MSTQATQPVITYTEEEQKALAELQNNARIFKNMILLLQNGLFPGNSYGQIAEALAVAQALFNQSQQALSGVQQSATQRSTQAPATKEKASSEKSNGSAKKVKLAKAETESKTDESVEN